ncbi:uridine/cytidine kinase [Natronococcus amylolyticus DSM 10524]|uniref:Uridine kinase n=1 Tax=Natronococcus amylolyticus DSM 10524 TaxID=1227497 RepID=L9XD93_9EURY|nr:uridine kinase [Natronococcus amylolyticus]ELY59684.1 uridine/cytidine kinase [Natronococcus amylolyticus DSM 10524]
MSIPSFVIGIAGGTGAGKTTVSRTVAETVGEAVTRIPLDNYYEDLSHLDYEERAEVNYDHPDAFEWELLREQLDSLLMGQPVEMPQYDFEVHNRKDERVTVEPSDVIVLEGILSLFDEQVLEMLDLKVYVMTDADVRILRRIERDVIDRGRGLEGVIDQYLETVKPMHEQFVAPTKKNADVIIPEGANRMAVDLLVEKVEAELAPGDSDADGDQTFPLEVGEGRPTRVDADPSSRPDD